MLSATVAGNRNADDISPELRKFDHLLYTSTTIHRTPRDLHAALLTSFGFGQVGGIILVLHPAHVLAKLSPEALEEYKVLRTARQGRTYTRMHAAITRNNLVQVKDAPPYDASVEDTVLLNPLARRDYPSGKWTFPDAPVEEVVPPKSAEAIAMAAALERATGCGVDVSHVPSFPAPGNPTFVERSEFFWLQAFTSFRVQC